MSCPEISLQKKKRQFRIMRTLILVILGDWETWNIEPII